MATIYATGARALLYKKCEQELQDLFSKIEAAVDNQQTSLIYDGTLYDLQLEYLRDCQYKVKAITWADGSKMDFPKDATSYEIKW